MSMFRREQRQWAPEPMINPVPGMSAWGGGSPSIDHALQVSAVWACVRLLADTVSSMPVHAFTFSGPIENPIRKPAPDPMLLRYPAAGVDVAEWLYALMSSLLLRGNAYGEVMSRDSNQRPRQIELQDPERCSVRLSPTTGLREYRFGTRIVPTEDVFHVRRFVMPGRIEGLSPIEYASREISTDTAVQDFAYGFFRDGAHPTSLLSTEDDLDQTQADIAKERFKAAVKGREPAVISGTWKHQQIQIAPNESQFLETQKATVATIARVFGVPPELVGGTAGDSMTYANVEQRSIDFLTYSVAPWLRRIEAALSALLPGQQHVMFDTEALLRTDLKTRMEATAIGIASKQLDPDEARAMSGRPPLTAAQKKLLALVPLKVSVTGQPQSVNDPSSKADPTTPGEGNDG